MGMALGVAASLDSVTFFQVKTKPKEEKLLLFCFPLKLAYFDFVLPLGFKTKRSLRSDVDRSTDRSTERQINRQDDNCNPLVH